MTSTLDTTLFSLDSDHEISDVTVLKEIQSAMSAIRMGQPFLIKNQNAHHLCIALDGLTGESLAGFLSTERNRSPLLILSAKRGNILGFDNDCPISMPFKSQDNVESLSAIAADHPAKISRRPILEQEEAKPALELLGLAKVLPACLFFANVSNVEHLKAIGITLIDAAVIARYEQVKLSSLRRKSKGSIPISGNISAQLVVFQYATGENEIALIIGNPDPLKELPIRIHSSCATGDIFGSERCDCGNQLRLGIEKLDKMGGGAIIYLDQEGRGIGLANKMRAYGLQDQSLDTVDANHALGFADDHRSYAVAATMIRALGWQDVAVLTNNPLKVNALTEYGINVTQRIAHQAPVNENNNQYLRTKAKRSGHILDY